MFITLTKEADAGVNPDISVNIKHIISFESYYKKQWEGVINKVKKDKEGYPEVFTKVITRKETFYVLQSTKEILDQISNMKNSQASEVDELISNVKIHDPLQK